MKKQIVLLEFAREFRALPVFPSHRVRPKARLTNPKALTIEKTNDKIQT
jgi:hypothetical protein